MKEQSLRLVRLNWMLPIVAIVLTYITFVAVTGGSPMMIALVVSVDVIFAVFVLAKLARFRDERPEWSKFDKTLMSPADADGPRMGEVAKVRDQVEPSKSFIAMVMGASLAARAKLNGPGRHHPMLTGTA